MLDVKKEIPLSSYSLIQLFPYPVIPLSSYFLIQLFPYPVIPVQFFVQRLFTPVFYCPVLFLYVMLINQIAAAGLHYVGRLMAQAHL